MTQIVDWKQHVRSVDCGASGPNIRNKAEAAPCTDNFGVINKSVSVPVLLHLITIDCLFLYVHNSVVFDPRWMYRR